VLGRLVARGLHDELKGSAYAIVEGVDGRTHHLRFSDLEMTGDAKSGTIVEARVWTAAAATGMTAADFVRASAGKLKPGDPLVTGPS
jgi:Protein of unknown function (DUF3363)